MSSSDDVPNENGAKVEKVSSTHLVQETRLSNERNEKLVKKEQITKSTGADSTRKQSQSSSQNEKPVETVYAGASIPRPVGIAQRAKEKTKEEDDPCIKKEIKKDVTGPLRFKTPGLDPRFQQQNQTMRCYVMYTDFYRCEKILGEGAEACVWFKEVFTSVCPTEWVRRWDEYRAEGRFPWFRHKTQGKFPGKKYGDV